MISVIIPTYNRARLVARAVENVLAQTHRDLEVIVVDDGSEDGTRQAVEAIGDKRVRYARQAERRGACAARNRGVELAGGEYIAFQDSDDLWMPDKLERQLRRLGESGADVVCCAFERYDKKGNFQFVVPKVRIPSGRVTYEQLLQRGFISTQTLLGKRACFVRFPFDETMPRLQDWELMLRMVRHCDVRFFDDVLVRMYEQADSITAQPELGLAALERIYGMHGEAIAKNEKIAAHLLAMREAFSYPLGIPCWRNYLGGLSLGQKPSTNIYLLLRAVRSLRVYLRSKGEK